MNNFCRQNSIVGFCHEYASGRKCSKATITRREQPKEANSTTFQPVRQGPTDGQNMSLSDECTRGPSIAVLN